MKNQLISFLVMFYSFPICYILQIFFKHFTDDIVLYLRFFVENVKLMFGQLQASFWDFE